MISLFRSRSKLTKAIGRHFSPVPATELMISERIFPTRMRPDLQRALEEHFRNGDKIEQFSGLFSQHSHESIGFANLLDCSWMPVSPAPPAYDDVDIGEESPARCLQNGLWLVAGPGRRYAVLLAMHSSYGQTNGMRVQVATTRDDAGAAISQTLFRGIEVSLTQARSFRGKVLSLEKKEQYDGTAAGIVVHHLRAVSRENVILPGGTLELLDRNVIQFTRQRDKLAAMGQPTKKGVLFYGAPGTGKTHTIHYLAGSLPGHTTLLVSAEQVALLSEYMTLARLLQPSIVVLEDVDLIARDRTRMQSACEESLLNRLLNEMDGLKPDAQILFILTTNRPEQLEAALASRPGRVDQAIEFPLPDDEGRRKLVRLYSGNAAVADEVTDSIVRRTQGVSAAFIRELMRRCAQFHLEREESRSIDLSDVDSALDEMLYRGGSLNLKLLGGAMEDVQ